MIVLDHQQGSPEWKLARLGLPTASCFKQIVTPKGALSSSADRYLARLFAEWYLGQSLDEASSEFMERGTSLEDEARRWYEFDREVTTRRVGLCLTDDRAAGASPDSLVGDDGLLEIKCPSAIVHSMYLLGGITDEYRVQIQGQLWVTGRKWCDLLSYNPALPNIVVRFERDDKLIGVMADALGVFCNRLALARETWRANRDEYHASLKDTSPDADPFASVEEEVHAKF